MIQHAAAFLKFLALVYPDLRKYALDLFKRHDGNPVTAKIEIKHITDHGGQLREFEAEIDERMRELKAATTGQGGGGQA